jgi:hypothetical protein
MGNVRIENSDSNLKTYTISITDKVSGSSSTISIAGSTTATYSCQCQWSGGSHDATVTGGGVDFKVGPLQAEPEDEAEI